jgi:hypothetical protein
LENNISEELIKIIIICFTSLCGIIIITIGAKNKWFTSMSIGKGGVLLETKEIEKAEKEFQSGNIQQLMNEQIYKCDEELINFAVEKANYLRKTIANHLSAYFTCMGIRQAITGILRFPLYNASRQNNFKSQLKPENILWYVERLMHEIKAEYEEYALLQNMAYCVIDEKKCPQMPDANEIMIIINHEVLYTWALAIRRKTVDICEKKIEVYRQFAPSFQELNDQVRIKVTEHCIEKNKNYIGALTRKPDLEKKEI